MGGLRSQITNARKGFPCKASTSDNRSKQKNRTNGNSGLKEALENIYKQKHLFLWRSINSGFNCSMHASSWCECLFSTLKRRDDKMSVKGLDQSIKAIDQYLNETYIDAMDSIKSLNQDKSPCMKNDFQNIIRPFGWNATVKAAAKSRKYSILTREMRIADRRQWIIAPSEVPPLFLHRVKCLCDAYNIKTKDICFLRCTRRECECFSNDNDKQDIYKKHSTAASEIDEGHRTTTEKTLLVCGRIVACYQRSEDTTVPPFLGNVEWKNIDQFIPILCTCQIQISSGIPCPHMLCAFLYDHHSENLLPYVPIWLYSKKYIKARQFDVGELPADKDKDFAALAIKRELRLGAKVLVYFSSDEDDSSDWPTCIAHEGEISSLNDATLEVSFVNPALAKQRIRISDAFERLHFLS